MASKPSLRCARTRTASTPGTFRQPTTGSSAGLVPGLPEQAGMRDRTVLDQGERSLHPGLRLHRRAVVLTGKAHGLGDRYVTRDAPAAAMHTGHRAGTDGRNPHKPPRAPHRTDGLPGTQNQEVWLILSSWKRETRQNFERLSDAQFCQTHAIWSK